jgi:alkanesulfonate monooxygenase SsuD/methylene tetrahydromethanopterin reductase-like flavin-dependent oxidoreductase (luciferase family)
MRFCMNVPIFGEYADVRLLATMAREAEDAGWDGFFVWDHLQWTGGEPGAPLLPSVDPVVATTAIALNTERVRIGPLVTPLPRRRPWKVARESTTLDHLSGGRLIQGVGIGYPPDLEFASFGEEADAKVRAEKLDEGLQVLTGLWRGEPFSFSGKHYRIDNALMLPRPVQEPRIPIWVAGIWPTAKAPFRRAAQWDGVQPVFDRGIAPEHKLAEVRRMAAYVREQRQSDAPFDIVVDGETAGDGSAGDAQRVREYAEAGVTWWLEGISSWRGGLATMRERIRRGPPRFD